MGEAAEQLAEELRSGAALGNYKSALQEHLQADARGSAGLPGQERKRPRPSQALSGRGPARRQRKASRARRLARGMGSTKKNAEQDAARRALERLKAAQKKAGARQDRRPRDGKEEPAAQ